MSAVEKVEVLVIGAGAVGTSVGMNLGRMGVSGVRVVDVDLEGVFSSSELNAGGVRATLSQPVNIRLSKLSIEYLSSVASEVGYRPCGYLWMHPESRREAALAARERQVAEGWPVEVWDVSELRRRVPFIDKPDGIAVTIFGPRDGLVNPNTMKEHFRSEARARGVRFDDRIWIRSAEWTPAGAVVRAWKFERVLSPEERKEILTRGGCDVAKREIEYHADRVVNCAGAWASGVARLFGYECPSMPVRRQICVFDSRDVDLSPYGMMIDPSGVYFHPEGGNGMAGYAVHEEPEGVNFEYEGESFFMERIWPALYERSSGFERLRHLNGWAGLYEVSPDESAIVGLVELGEPKKGGRMYEAHSFSGHGTMQAYGAGLALAERMVRGRYETIDLTELSGLRFAQGREIPEKFVI